MDQESPPTPSEYVLERLRFVVKREKSAALDKFCDAYGVARPISFEPGEVMTWEKYRELEAQQK